VLEERKPSALILGELSPSHMAYLKVGELAYTQSDNVSLQLKKVKA
jgi:hypothetical protein